MKNKKYRIFFVNYWKYTVLSIIFYALFVSGFCGEILNPDTKKIENKAAAADSPGDTEDLRKQLADVLLKAEKQEEDVTRIKIAAAAMLGDNYRSGADEKMLDAIKDLELNTKQGKYLVMRVLNTCGYLDNEIAKLKIPEDDKVRLQCRVDELRTAAENFGVVISRPLTGITKNSIEIIDMDKKLQAVILGAGLLDGIRTGLILKVVSKDKQARMTVVSVRNYICAALITEGDLSVIKIGMKATIN